MTWSPAFLAHLSGGALALRWALRVARHVDGRTPYVAGVYDERRVIGAPVISGAAVTLGSWQSTGSTLTVGLDLSDIPGAAHYRIPRGTIIELVARYRPSPGTFSAEEVVFRGVVHSLDVQGHVATLQARDLLGMLKARPSTGGTDLWNLYDGYNNVSELLSAYNPTDTSLDTVTNVTTTGSGVTGYAVAYVEPVSGAPFYLRHTTGGSSANSLTDGGSPLVAVLGSVAVTAAVGSRVTTFPAYQDHPISTVQRILATGGEGSADPYDAAGLDDTWGCGLHRAWRDDQSFDDCRDKMAVTGVTYRGTLLPAEQRYALQYLSASLAPWAGWLVSAQGVVGVRLALDPWRRRPPGAFRRLSSREVVAVRPAQVYPTDVPAQARFARVYTGWPATYGDGILYGVGDGWPSYTGDARTGPVVGYTSTDLSEWLQPNRGDSEADAEAIAEEVATRIAGWTARVPVVYDVVCTLAAAGLAAGDWCRLGPGLPYWSRTRRNADAVTVMVLSVSEDWGRGQVALRLAELPPDSAERP